MSNKRRRKNMEPEFELPYENLYSTKTILRMGMQLLAFAIADGQSVKELCHLMQETSEQVEKLNDPEVTTTFQHMRYLIEHNYPICESTDWEIIHELGDGFRLIDRKTIY